MTRLGGASSTIVLVTLLACSSKTAPTQDGAVQSNADAFVQATVCSVPWLLAGQAAEQLPVTVHDGDTSGAETYTVACTVRPQGAGYDVSLSIVDQGPHGGSVTLASPAGAGDVTTGGGSSISATFANAQGEIARASGCTIAFTYQGQNVSMIPSVSPTRIWGHVSCPAAKLGTEAGVPEAGGAQCDAEADFLFEGCAQ